MPLEISEIGVHIAVGGPAKEPPPEEPAGGQPAEGGQGMTPAQLNQITEGCVEQVLANLKQEQER